MVFLYWEVFLPAFRHKPGFAFVRILHIAFAVDFFYLFHLNNFFFTFLTLMFPYAQIAHFCKFYFTQNLYFQHLHYSLYYSDFTVYFKYYYALRKRTSDKCAESIYNELCRKTWTSTMIRIPGFWDWRFKSFNKNVEDHRLFLHHFNQHIEYLK